MCLTYNATATRAFRKKHKGKATVRVWKVMRRPSNGSCGPLGLQSRFRDIVQYRPWYAGQNISSRESRKLTDKERETAEVNKGFHVYLRRRAAVCHAHGINVLVVIPFTARMSEFVGCDMNGEEAVFTKLTLSEHAFRKAQKET